MFLASKIGFDLYTRSTCTRVYTVLMKLSEQGSEVLRRSILKSPIIKEYYFGDECAQLFVYIRHKIIQITIWVSVYNSTD